MIIFSVQDLLASGTEDWIKLLLQNALVYGLGYQMIGFAVGHILFGDTIAQYIGWEKGSPFQFETGLGNLAIGILGIMCGWFTGLFWLATVIAASIFFEGCMLGHIRDMAKDRNFSPGSAGYPFFWDLLFPIYLIGLLIAY